jgi:hypothetical protein
MDELQRARHAHTSPYFTIVEKSSESPTVIHARPEDLA